MFTRLLLIILVLGSTAQADDFFNEKIEPLLKTHCYDCHSHESVIEAGLALDSRSGWEKGGNSGPAIIPGNPGGSLLLKMVSWSDDQHQMPPEEKLSDDNISLLNEWVKRGAPDPRVLEKSATDPLDWWSLKPLKRSSVPAGTHPVDAFIKAKLDEQGLKPAPEADRRTLIRRAYLDLHGLLPTPDQVDAFINDPSPDAWEKLIDELLASPRYGERWARHWLDVIHFADSHGCEHDVKRPNAWRFRDYVINRFNEDISWGRFIREQIAADVLYPSEPQLNAALGFISAGPLELSRAGTAPVTFDYLDRDDIVTQTMAAFTSTTANCARCHTHKFDPITQEDYYSLQAVFAGVGKGDIEFDTDPQIHQQREEWKTLLAAAERQDPQVLLQEKYASVVNEWIHWRKQQTVTWTSLDPDVFIAAGGATLTKQDDGSIFAGGHLAEQETYTVTTSVDLQRLTALKLEVLKDERHPHGGPGRAGNGNLHLTEIELQWFPTGGAEPAKLKVANATADYDQPDWTSKKTYDGDLQSGWAIYPRVNESHFIVFELAEPLDISNGGKLAVSMKQLYPPTHIIGRFRLSATDADPQAARVMTPEAAEGIIKPEDQHTLQEKAALAALALHPYAALKLNSLPPKVVGYGVSAYWSHAKKLTSPQAVKTVHLLRRGDIDKPVREVSPGALSAIDYLPARFELSNPEQETSRRAALAEWLAHHDNPLTWRSVVNRVWYYHFGRGICETPNDFGRMGGLPSHPELLDWLAVWFRDDAQGSMKQLHRLIMTSETWKQASRVPSNQSDADNRLLWRMNRRRLDADSFRDSVLQLTGRLDLTMGGPGIEQFITSQGPQATPKLDYSAYDWNSLGATRRSIYRVVWRGIPDPFMEAMDFPDLALLTPKRNFSVSALQSLAIYNNDFVLTASEWFANRLKQECEEPERERRAAQLCWQREPTTEELIAFKSYSRTHGLAALCRVLLNSNELLFVD